VIASRVGLLCWISLCTSLLATLISTKSGEAQSLEIHEPPPREAYHLRWPLLDIVMAPDTAGVWLLAGPNPATQQWQARSHLVSLWIDPVAAIQWVTVARGLAPTGGRSSSTSARATPPLRGKRDSSFIVLAANSPNPSAEGEFIFLVSDSAADIHWKTLASAAQVDTLLATLEHTAVASRSGSVAWKPVADPDPDVSVRIISQPCPAYPARLADNRRIGRVWMTFVVRADGRPDPESFWPVLSDDSLFTQAAIEALLRSRFRPARSKGQPVPQRVFQAILFRMR
jgi:hypothetical protein